MQSHAQRINRMKPSPKTGMPFFACTSDTGTRTTYIMKLLMAKSNAGRIFLHLLCLLRGGNCRFHWAGVTREFKGICKNARTIFSLLAFATAFNACRSEAQVECVDTKIGNVGIMLEPTRPTVSIPNSMVRVYPVRKDGLDDQIQSFPLTIISHR